MTTFNLNTFIPYLITLTGAAVSDAFSSVYQDKLTNPQWRVVCHLMQAQSPLTPKQLCDKAMLDKSTASRAVGDLQRMRWVEVRPCLQDRRARQVSLTALGQQEFAAMLPSALAWQTQLLAEFDEQEKAVLLTLLAKLEQQALAIKKAHQ
ncbi:MarR family winged helix-turn-helix transcriptional regulator [Pseudoalteromonas sp. YIC-656]|uniref:MarR family winged helix-turn-helix transcriptional regulator n=1 Tax=Pseudoalteromonas pernae TaxID=3118054 RepID=UPI0032423423